MKGMNEVKTFKNLTQVKREIGIGDNVIITNLMKDEKETRQVTGKNTVGIKTFSHTAKALNGKLGVEIILSWQKAKDTRVSGNKIYFLANENTVDKWLVDDLKERGLDYWLVLEVL